MEKWTNLVPSLVASSTILLNIKIYDYFHRDKAMFREKATIVAPKKEVVAINMVLVVTTHS
jgi:hypothetical protein